MMRRCLFGVAIALLLAGSATFAQDQGRIVKHEDTFGMVGTLIGPCGEAVILTTASIAATYVDRYATDGTLVQTVASFRTVSPSVYFLAASEVDKEPLNDKRVWGVPGESQINRYSYSENRVYVQGAALQATVPHYGRVFSQTGRTVFELPNWTILSVTGLGDAAEQDFAALCAYLSQ